MQTDFESLLPFLTALKRQTSTPQDDDDGDAQSGALMETQVGTQAGAPAAQTKGDARFRLLQPGLNSSAQTAGGATESGASTGSSQATEDEANGGAEQSQDADEPSEPQGGASTNAADPGQRGHELMDNREVQAEAYRLYGKSGYGRDRREHSMWVISQDGEYQFVQWPWSAQTDKEVWKGPPPAGAVAVVHTHPTATGEQPSGGDQDLADGKQSKNVRMPVYVIHSNGIWKAVPDGKNPVHIRDYRWVDEFKP